jgi:hypothetical protein
VSTITLIGELRICAGNSVESQTSVRSLSASHRNKECPGIALLKQILKELSPIRTQNRGKAQPFSQRPVFPHRCFGNASDSRSYRLNHRIRYDETVSPNAQIDFSSPDADVDLYDVVRQLLRLPRRALYVLNFELSHGLTLGSQISFSTIGSVVSVTKRCSDLPRSFRIQAAATGITDKAMPSAGS